MNRGRPKTEGETRTELVRFRVKPSDLEHWKTEAEAAGLPLSTWFETLANQTSEREAAGELPTKTRTNLMSLKVSNRSLEAYDQAAAEAGFSRHTWAKTILDMAANVSELPIQLARIIKWVPEEPKPVKDGKW